jgi:hypothetical protein
MQLGESRVIERKTFKKNSCPQTWNRGASYIDDELVGAQ